MALRTARLGDREVQGARQAPHGDREVGGSLVEARIVREGSS